jgi:hypothetical protein
VNTTPGRLPTRPLRDWFLAWHIHTGDSPEVIAKGFDLEAVLVAEMLGGRPPLMIDRSAAIQICRSIRLAPSTLWRNDDVPQRTPRFASDLCCSDLPKSLLEALHVEITATEYFDAI